MTGVQTCALPISNFKMEMTDSFPCIYDRTQNTSIDPAYFYQDAWCARRVFENKPASHVDVASKVEMVSIISQLIPTTFIDIRPLELPLAGLSFKKGSVTDMPFTDNEVESLSSMCVVEHIGLGRYGDDIDSFGSEKAIKEFIRVLKPGGNLYLSVPIDIENKIYFNAHRAFTRDYILKIADRLELAEEKYVYGKNLCDDYDSKKGFGTGMFHFRKK